MSEIERLIAAANKAREFSFALGPRAQIVLRVPTAYELEIASAGRVTGDTGAVQFFRGLLEQCVVGWSGIVEADLVPDLPKEPAPEVTFDRALVPLLLDTNPVEAVSMRDALLDRLSKRAARKEAARKN